MDWGKIKKKNWFEAFVSKLSSFSKVNLQSPERSAQQVCDGIPKL